MLISRFIIRICPLGIGLAFPFYFDSSYLLGSVEKYIFIVSVCAAFTHDCLTLRVALRNDEAALQSNVSKRSSPRGKGKMRWDSALQYFINSFARFHFYSPKHTQPRSEHKSWHRSVHLRATRRGDNRSFGAARRACTALKFTILSANLSFFWRPQWI